MIMPLDTKTHLTENQLVQGRLDLIQFTKLSYLSLLFFFSIEHTSTIKTEPINIRSVGQPELITIVPHQLTP